MRILPNTLATLYELSIRLENGDLPVRKAVLEYLSRLTAAKEQAEKE